MNAPISLKPFGSETKSSIWAIDKALPWEPRGADAFGALPAAGFELRRWEAQLGPRRLDCVAGHVRLEVRRETGKE